MPGLLPNWSLWDRTRLLRRFCASCIVDAGLPEPQLQCRLDPADPQSPPADMAYRGKKLCLQYEGARHFTAERQAAAQGRNWQFTVRGWTVMLTNRVDLQESFCGVVSRLAAVLAQ